MKNIDILHEFHGVKEKEYKQTITESNIMQLIYALESSLESTQDMLILNDLQNQYDKLIEINLLKLLDFILSNYELKRKNK